MDGSDMAPAAARPTKLDRVISVGRWFKNSFAEWLVGSWALIAGWLICGVIFFNFLLMDGHFSRGLGEGSGVDPSLFQNVGWMYRCFAALFLVLAVKLAYMGLKRYAVTVRVLGLFITIIVVLHATGFGLKALEGKRANAEAVETVSTVASEGNAATIETLKAQIAGYEQTRDRELANLQSSIDKITGDGLDNDHLADEYRKDQSEERRIAREAIAAANTKILDLTTTGGAAKTQAAQDIATTEKWAPLFVGLAQFFTQDSTPDDWSIYLCGVFFIVFWVLVGDAIAIVLPSALYELHLRDAKPRHVKLTPGVFKDLQEQADELARRKANLGEGVNKRTRGKKRKEDIAANRLAIEDLRAELARREEVQEQDEATSEPVADGPTVAVDEPGEPEATLDLTAEDVAPESPGAQEPANEPEADNQQDKAA